MVRHNGLRLVCLVVMANEGEVLCPVNTWRLFAGSWERNCRPQAVAKEEEKKKKEMGSCSTGEEKWREEEKL